MRDTSAIISQLFSSMWTIKVNVYCPLDWYQYFQIMHIFFLSSKIPLFLYFHTKKPFLVWQLQLVSLVSKRYFFFVSYKVKSLLGDSEDHIDYWCFCFFFKKLPLHSSDNRLLEKQIYTVPKSFGTARFLANKSYRYPTKIRMN